MQTNIDGTHAQHEAKNWHTTLQHGEEPHLNPNKSPKKCSFFKGVFAWAGRAGAGSDFSQHQLGGF